MAKIKEETKEKAKIKGKNKTMTIDKVKDKPKDMVKTDTVKDSTMVKTKDKTNDKAKDKTKDMDKMAMVKDSTMAKTNVKFKDKIKDKTKDMVKMVTVKDSNMVKINDKAKINALFKVKVRNTAMDLPLHTALLKVVLPPLRMEQLPLKPLILPLLMAMALQPRLPVDRVKITAKVSNSQVMILGLLQQVPLMIQAAHLTL